MQDMVKAQLKIQQMAFMIVAVFFFFLLIGMAYLSYQFASVKTKYADLQKEEAIRSLETLTNMPELSCSESFLCIDEDKLYALSVKGGYDELWPVASIKVYKIYPSFKGSTQVKCPDANCNYYLVYDSGQKSVEEYASFVSLCKKVREGGYTYNKCEIGKLAVGVKLTAIEEE